MLIVLVFGLRCVLRILSDFFQVFKEYIQKHITVNIGLIKIFLNVNEVSPLKENNMKRSCILFIYNIISRIINQGKRNRPQEVPNRSCVQPNEHYNEEDILSLIGSLPIQSNMKDHPLIDQFFNGTPFK
ncbi:hypothetical protein RCL_jg16441.t1 [Rhizophagus clarus]|uniref:Uncharacterized protein n=1 Tax=Rhizophagus clarus TaxID=94130 RepID=A0A8H3R0E3_9GLOM|nr:hypothetical protein RCL_jg16441.t1 [Rhizophagus clarus]